MGNWWEEQPKPTGSLASLQPTVQPPSVPAFDSAANNPYATQLAQSLQAYRNRPSRFSTEPASLPTPAQPPEASQPAGAWQTLKDIGGGLVETFRGIPGVVASSMEGVENPYAEVDWKDRTIEENRQRQQANLQALRDSGEFDRPMGLGMPFTRGEWAETTQSFPYTAATMGPALVGGAVGSAIGGALGGLGGPAAPATVPAGVAAGRAIGGTLGGMLGAYLPAGGAATNQFIRDSLDKYRQDFSAKNGREPSPEEIDAHYKTVVEPQAARVYHGEAAPEAAGTVAELGLMKSAIGDVLNSGGSLPMRIAKAGGKVALSAFGIEPATETLTQQIQQPAYAATGLTDEAPRSLTSPEDWLKSAGEVYKQAAATSLFFSALGIPAGAMYGKYQQRREGNARVEDATQATADLRANLEFAREDDITTALTGFDQIETSGTLPKAAAKRLDAARQQLIEELSLRAAPDALNEPLDTRRGQAGYLGFADRANELNDDQVFEAAQRPLPQDAPAELQDARARYGQEAKRRQDLNLAAAHFEQNPEAVDGVAKVLADIGDGEPLNKGGHGSVDYNLSSLSDDMLARYRMAGTVLLRDHAETLGNRAEKLNKTLSLLSEETERRASGQRRDPQAIREADIAQKIAKGEKNAKKLLTGLSPDAMERMASGLESRSQLEPGLADTAREIRALANKERARLFNPQGAKQPGIQSALRGWNQNQPNMPAPQGQPLDQQIAADRARLSELAQQQVERQRQEKLADRTQAIQQQEADRRARLNAEIATRGRPGLAELARLLGPEIQAPTIRQETPAPQSLSDLLNRPSQSSAVPTARAGERGSLSDLFPQQRSTNRNWWDTELSPSKATTETPAPPKSGWARFGNETGTLNIPRAEMPQVKAEHRGALVNFLNARGVTHEADTEVDPATLKPTQAEFSPQKVRKAINYQGGDRSILVSSDGYVLDGHHQWLAALEQGKPIKAIRLDAPIANLLPLTREFPSSTVSTASNVRGGQTGRVETPTTAAPTQPEIPNEARKAEAEAAPLLNQAPDVVAPQPEDSGVAPSPAPTAKGAAPLWNRANEDERIALLRQPSGSAGSSVSDDFARRKAVEWKTWADIPEGPAKNRLREALKNQEIQNAIENPSASPPDGGGGAQPSIRQEGGNPAESSQGIQQGGQENRSPAQDTGSAEIVPVSPTSQAPSHIDEQGETAPATDPVVNEALMESVKTTQTAKQKQAAIAGHLTDVFKQIDEAISAAPNDKNNANGTVLINVPGDGKFKIANNQQALRDFRGKIEKSAAFKRSGISNKPSSPSKPSSKPTDPGTAIIYMTSSGDIQGTANALNLADAREYPVIISNNSSGNDHGFLNRDWKSDLLNSKPDIYVDAEPYRNPVFAGTSIDAVSARTHEGLGKGHRFRIIDRNTGIVIWEPIKSISNRNALIDAFNARLKSFANIEYARNKVTKNFNSKINDMAKSLGVDHSPSEIKKAMDDRANEWANAVQGEQDAKEATESEQSKPSSPKNKDESQQNEVTPAPQIKPDETADQQPTTETNKQTTDAGDELSYNRRNRLSRGLRWSDIDGLNDTLKAKESTKGKVWPRPNYEQLVKDGVSPTIAYLVKHAYDALSPSPKPSSSREILTSQAFEDYINGVVRYMSGVMQWAESTKQFEIDGPYADPVRGLLNDLQNIVYKEMVLHNRELARIGGNQSVGDGLLPRYKVLRKIESVLRDGWPASQEAWQKSYQIRESEQGFYVTKKGYTQRRSDYFKTQDEAIESARQLTKRARGQDQGIDLGTRVDQAERIGIQYRESGNNVSTQDLLDTFGFRGVNFGNWMKGNSNESERQAHINHAYDAFMDLADLLHVPPKAISLNGMLGFAIGAQGHGKGVAAHFVPGVNEINLTRESGAGALAHEWAHALDHYFAVQGGQSTASEPFMTQLVESTKKDMSIVRQEIRDSFSRIVKAMRERPKTSEEIEKDNQESISATRQNVDAWLKSIERNAGISNNSAFNRIADKIRDGKLGDGVMKLGKSRYQVAPTIHELGELVKQVTGRSVDNDQMADLYGAAKIAKIREERLAAGHQSPLDTVTPTTYSKNADALDQGKGGKRYWSTNLEMFARAFDAYVSDRLDAMGGKNSYLSHAGRVGNTVPEGQERKTINSAFDQLISEIKTEKTDSGVRLYSMANKPATPITPAQTRADLSRTLGADVVARLEQSGRLVIHDKPPTGAAAGAQGWVDQKGVIHLVPANLESSALSVVLHESAHLMRDDRFSPENRALGRAAHAVLRISGLQGLIGNPSYNDLIQNVYRLAAEGNKTAQAALAKATVEPGNTAEEALSYIVEYADEKLPIYRRIMSAIRAALYRLGIKVNLTPADLRALALSALKSRAKEVTARNAQPAFSLPESAEAEPEQDQLWREFQAVRAQFQERQASQSAFERWFGQGVEGVNVHKGKPLTLFHGTNNPEFNRWDESLSGQASRHPTAGLGFFMTADARSAARYGSRLLELNAKINKPYFMTDADLTSIEDTKDAARFRRNLQAQGYDAAVIVAPGAAPYVVAFQSNQVKLTSNTNPTESEDFRYSRPHRWADGLPAEIASMAEKIGAEPKPWIDRLRDMRDSLPTRIRQGTIDRFARLLENDRARFGRDVIDTDTALSSWVAAKMSKSPEGALEAAFLHGRIKWDNGAINVQETKQGLAKALEPIASAGELNRFWQWIIAKRSNRLMREGRERLFTPQEIASGLTLNSGTMADGNDRNAVYRRAFSRYVEIQKSVLDVAEQSGLFNATQRAQWEHDFYLPYYRVIEDEGELRGPSNGGGKLVRQKAFEKLKGGTEKLGDPLQNILRNWHHLIDASLKNRAASLALDTAETLGAAQRITSTQTDKHSVWIMKNGDKEYYRVDDPLTLDAVSALSAPLLNNTALKPFAFLKRALTIGVTISPAFKAANLLRDSIATMAISTISPNVFKVNPIKGMMLAREGAPTQASLLAGGGTFRFGTLLEGDPAAAARRIAGWKPDTVLDSPAHIRGFYDLLKKGAESWTRFGDLMETANRASLYDQLRKEGKTHLQASLAARDIMDFSQSGSAMATRLLVGVVPFINARLQGMDVLYRKGFQPLSRTVTGRASAIERQQALRFAAATFAVAAASVLLYLNYKDDDEFQKREQWDRDNYWWFKIGDNAYRIPKPFEVGALGTIAERIVEQVADKNASGKLFADRLKFMLTQTFSMDPTPQLIKPIIDVYANKDSFTKRPIEPMGMENLSPELRSRYNTSALAIATSKAGLGKVGLSPLQIEHLTRGYFGWLGAQALLIGDYGARPFMGLPNRPIKQSDIPVIGDLLQRFKPDGRGIRYITEFYEQAKQLRQIAADARLYLQLRDYDALNKLIAKQGNELQQSFAVEAVARKFGEFGRLEREIASDKSMSGDEKRRLIDELNKNKSNAAKQVMEKLR